MMVSSESQNDLNELSRKIDAALTFPNKRVVDDNPTETSNSEFSTCLEFLKYLDKERDVYIRGRRENKFQYNDKLISSSFPSHQYIMKSKILNDEKLMEAILYSKIFENILDFARHRDEYKGQMVWLEMDVSDSSSYSNNTTTLISGNKMIYDTDRENIDLIRQDLETNWEFLKDAAKKNLLEALSVPVSVSDPNKEVSDLQSPLNTAVSSNAPSKVHQKMTTMTEEMKKIVLDELISLNLDPRLKQQFEFDLKVFADKDVSYWRDRLDGLRCCSNSAPACSAQSQELEQMRLKIAELEKKTASLHDAIHSLPKLFQVSKQEELESQPGTSTDVLLKEQMNPSLIAEGTNISEEKRTNEEKFREMLDEYSTWLTTDQIHELLMTTLEVQMEMMKTSAKNRTEETKSQELENSAGVKTGIECKEISSWPGRKG